MIEGTQPINAQTLADASPTGTLFHGLAEVEAEQRRLRAALLQLAAWAANGGTQPGGTEVDLEWIGDRINRILAGQEI